MSSGPQHGRDLFAFSKCGSGSVAHPPDRRQNPLARLGDLGRAYDGHDENPDQTRMTIEVTITRIRISIG